MTLPTFFAILALLCMLTLKTMALLCPLSTPSCILYAYSSNHCPAHFLLYPVSYAYISNHGPAQFLRHPVSYAYNSNHCPTLLYRLYVLEGKHFYIHLDMYLIFFHFRVINKRLTHLLTYLHTYLLTHQLSTISCLLCLHFKPWPCPLSSLPWYRICTQQSGPRDLHQSQTQTSCYSFIFNLLTHAVLSKHLRIIRRCVNN